MKKIIRVYACCEGGFFEYIGISVNNETINEIRQAIISDDRPYVRSKTDFMHGGIWYKVKNN